VPHRPRVGGVEIIDTSKLNSTKTASPPATHIEFSFAPAKL